ncbi:prepilin-type N-terminal cleavage/methylation domain-containing protein [uncultured Azohydromonas sp.]|jgi:Tfp pilus assembly protein PilW|uniref:prepilin-type N-terminal cleavage/methylation domain-containing protein n=1 Tax=uncultured Azohydromonas sp. TaxID=487342 RepID=UPI00260D6D0D|nr:prepilin-type N-terminal cleavage/methylation domain-containing protein [uncultured Azohydromonas sp.]
MRRHTIPRSRTRGLTLLELLVGLSLGLFVAAGAATLLSQFLGENRRLLLQMRLEQQTQALAELVLRDFRRAGAWRQADDGIARDGAAAPTNPYAALQGAAPEAAVDTLRFSYADGPVPEDTAPGTEPSAQAGFRLREGIVDARLGSRWQPLTDPALMTVTTFELRLRQRVLDLERHCARPRPLGQCPDDDTCPPRLLQRHAALQLEAQAAREPAIRHALQGEAALRNDVVEGVCPQ